MSLYDTRQDTDYRVVNPRPVCRANKHSMLDPENVWIKKSTGQRRCRACMKAKRQSDYQCEKEVDKGFFAFGEIWQPEQLRLASLPQLREQKAKMEKRVNKEAKALLVSQEHLQQVILAYQGILDKVYEDMTKGQKPVSEED